MKTNLKKLRSEHHALAVKIYAIEQKQHANEARALLGRHFKYRNCYSCPEKECDYWYIFAKVIQVSPDGGVVTLSFEVDSRGETKIMSGNSTSVHMLTESYVEISAKEFNEARESVRNRVEFLLS